MTKPSALEEEKEGGSSRDPDAGKIGTRDDAAPPEASTPESRPDATCAPAFATARDASPALIELVVDISNSMNDPANMESESSKWEVTRPELELVVRELPAHVAVGMVLFPGTLESHCFKKEISVPLEIVTDEQRELMLATIEEVVPYGGTATHDAYHLGLEALEDSPLVGERAALVLTDGQPNYSLGCVGDGDMPVDTAPLIDEAAEALSRGIRTFVVGVPGSEKARSDLSALAKAGGTGKSGCSNDGPEYCHVDLTAGDDLEASLGDALTRLTTNAARCQFIVPEAPEGYVFDPDRAVVQVEAQDETVDYPRGEEGACSNGWEPGQSQGTFRLCDEACQEFQGLSDEGDASIDISFVCR